MTEQRVKLRLGDWADYCDHPGVAGLPRLWAAVTVPGRAGWVTLALHWARRGWDTCIPDTWSLDGPDGDLGSLTDHAVASANETPYGTWVQRYREHLRDSLGHARSQLEWDEHQLANRRTQIRQLECAVAAAALDDPEAFTTAHRLMRDWNGSPDDLAPTARSLTAPPAVSDVGVLRAEGADGAVDPMG